MKPFLNKDFLLSTPTARHLYHDIAAELPIIDYHCHISPQEIAQDKHFTDISEVWLGGDHYKWRLMRACGLPERLITGDAPGREKFKAFAALMPQLIGNPMLHWSHLELQRVFGITEPLSGQNADAIYDQCNEQLAGLSAREIMKLFRVKAICTTDDPVDSLIWHESIADEPENGFDTQVRPAFRPDKAVQIEKPGFAAYIRQLEEVTGRSLTTADQIATALEERVNYFAARGCLCADDGLDTLLFAEPDIDVANEAVKVALSGGILTAAQVAAYQTLMLLVCARAYKRKGWVMQLHFGCLRNTNTEGYYVLGPDAGFDAMSSRTGAENLAALLNEMVSWQALGKLIVYSLNPGDNAAIDSVLGSFQGDAQGGLQHGSAWWFNDHIDGMSAQLRSLASVGVLGRFVGMLTDSRSFLSYTRHEYFRRLLCDLIGNWVESGQYPGDEAWLKALVQGICYQNTNEYFGFGL